MPLIRETYQNAFWPYRSLVTISVDSDQLSDGVEDIRRMLVHDKAVFGLELALESHVVDVVPHDMSVVAIDKVLFVQKPAHT